MPEQWKVCQLDHTGVGLIFHLLYKTYFSCSHLSSNFNYIIVKKRTFGH